MTLPANIKTLINKIKANEAQHNLDRETAKIFAPSSGELEKHEYLTGQDLAMRRNNLSVHHSIESLMKKTIKADNSTNNKTKS